MIMVGGDADLTVAYVGGGEDLNNAASGTVTTGIGAADNLRTVFALVFAKSASSSRIETCKIDGNAMSLLVRATTTGVPTAIFALPWPTGTSATFVVEADNPQQAFRVEIVVAYGLISQIPLDSDSDDDPSTKNRSATLDTAIGALLLACGVTDDSGSNLTWSANVTRKSVGVVEADWVYSVAFANQASAVAGGNVTVTADGSSAPMSVCAVSMR